MAARPTDDEIIASLPSHLPVGIWVARAPGGEFVYANLRFQEIMGISGRSDVAVGGYAEPYGICGLDGRPYPEARMPFVQALEARTTVMVDDIVIHRTDGGRVNIRAYAHPVIVDDAVDHVIIAFIDITREVVAEGARRASEERLGHAQRMESIGALAGGIAHDFNNLLGAIRLVATALAADEPDPARRAELERIEAATASARQLTRSLLGFAGQRDDAREPVWLDDQVRAVVDLLQRTLDPRIRLESELSARSRVNGNAAQLQQIAMNLVLNARDAMPHGGRIVVRTTRAGDRVLLDVIDTGPGIPPELRARVFEPYFTTRDRTDGHGRGLGLATVFGLARGHGGTAEVIPRDGGAHLRITLPVASDQPPAAAEPRAPASPHRPARVLVVDDEPMVREVTARALERLGHTVQTAAEGESAIAAFRAEPSFDLVILDLAMPGLNGRAVFQAIRQIRPDVRAVMASGYAADRDARDLVALGLRGFLHKPFGLRELEATVAAALSDAGTG